MAEYTYKNVQKSDIDLICGFPQNEDELFYMFPKAVYPLRKEQLQERIEQRFDSTVILCGEDVVGFAYLYDVKKIIQ